MRQVPTSPSIAPPSTPDAAAPQPKTHTSPHNPFGHLYAPLRRDPCRPAQRQTSQVQEEIARSLRPWPPARTEIALPHFIRVSVHSPDGLCSLKQVSHIVKSYGPKFTHTFVPDGLSIMLIQAFASFVATSLASSCVRQRASERISTPLVSSSSDGFHRTIANGTVYY